MVFISEACPGQSTKVNCICVNFSAFLFFSFNHSGISTKNAENPNSNVMPRSWLCGILSKAIFLVFYKIPEVEATVLINLQSEVLPLSICPKTPIFIFSTFVTSVIDLLSVTLKS